MWLPGWMCREKGRGPHTEITVVVMGGMVCGGGGDKRGQSHKAKVKSQGGSGQSYQVSQGSQRE